MIDLKTVIFFAVIAAVPVGASLVAAATLLDMLRAMGAPV